MFGVILALLPGRIMSRKYGIGVGRTETRQLTELSHSSVCEAKL